MQPQSRGWQPGWRERQPGTSRLHAGRFKTAKRRSSALANHLLSYAEDRVLPRRQRMRRIPILVLALIGAAGCPGREVAKVDPNQAKEQYHDIPVEVNRDI